MEIQSNREEGLPVGLDHSTDLVRAESVEPADDLSQKLLSTAHRLLSLDKVASFQEVLLTSIIETLSTGAQSVQSLLVGLEELWPASELRTEHVLEVLGRASELGLVRTSVDLIGDIQTWELTDSGRAEVRSAQDWYARALGRFSQEIQQRAANDLGTVLLIQAESWARLIVAALSQSMHSELDNLRGGVRLRVDGGLAPERFNISISLEYIDARVKDENVRSFLAAALLAAVDESEPFGNELASAVATAAVLRGVVSRQADADQLSSLGSLEGVRIVIDTPSLLDLLEAGGTALQIIKSAMTCGMEVIVFEHYLDELDDLLDRIAADHRAVVDAASTNREAAQVAALLADDQVVEIYLRGVASGRYSGWSEFRSAAMALRGTLAQAGVCVRPAGNIGQDTVERCERALVEVLEERGSTRGRKAIERDAEAMAAVWRWRRRASQTQTSPWPAGWILTRDTKMNAAFQRATGDEQEVTTTPSRLSTLLATSGPPADSSRLVSVAASHMRHEAMVAIAMRYPPQVAFDLAKGLVLSNTPITEPRIAQLGLGELLDQAGGMTNATGERLAAEVLARRTRRIDAAAVEAHRRSQEAERAAIERAANAESALMQKDQAFRQTLSELGDRPTREDLAAAVERERKIGNRRAARAAVVAALLVVGIIFGVSGWFYAAVGLIAAALWFYQLARDWVEDVESHWHKLLIACTAVVLGVLVEFIM